MQEQLRNWLLLASLLLAIGAISTTLLVGRRNRSMATAVQLAKDYYQDSSFTQQRLRLWSELAQLEKEDEFNYRWYVGLPANDESKDVGRRTDDVDGLSIALNRTAAFYHHMGALIERRKVDGDLLRKFFSYNYTYYWDPYRRRFRDNSEECDKYFFAEVPKLLRVGESEAGINEHNS